jgi:hypothetical protein
MTNTDKVMQNWHTQLMQILILIFIFWFLFLRESFFDIPMEEQNCEMCLKTIFNENNNISLTTFKNKCIEQGGEYNNKNNIKSCINYKAKLDSNYRCNCNIK